MATPSPVLSEMINDAPVKVAAAEQQITQIEDTQADLEDESTAIEKDICEAISNDTTGTMSVYLDNTKIIEIQALWPEVPGSLGPVYIVYGATYGTINYTTGNVTDWEFRQDNLTLPPPPIPPYYVRYVYILGDDPTIDQLVDDYKFGNDYITRPLDSGAAYGLDPLIAAYESAKTIIQAGKNKVEASVDIFTRYL